MEIINIYATQHGITEYEHVVPTAEARSLIENRLSELLNEQTGLNIVVGVTVITEQGIEYQIKLPKALPYPEFIRITTKLGLHLQELTEDPRSPVPEPYILSVKMRHVSTQHDSQRVTLTSKLTAHYIGTASPLVNVVYDMSVCGERTLWQDGI